MPINPSNRDFTGVLLPNQFGEKYHTFFKAGNRREILKPLNNTGNSLLTFLGAFKLSSEFHGDGAAIFASGVMTYNNANNSIFIVGHDHYQSIAEFSIPNVLGVLPDLSDSPTVSPTQNFHRPYVGTRDPYHKISGLFFENNKLIVNWYKFYDQGGEDTMINTTFLLDGANNLAASTLYGPVEVNGRQRAAGWISKIPAGNQSQLGGSYISGWTSSTLRAGVHVSSIGPAAFTVDYGSFLTDPQSSTQIPSTPLAWYNLVNLPRDPNYEGGIDSWLYNRDFDNTVWTHNSEGSYGIVVPNTDTYIVFGHTGGLINGIGYGQPPYGGAKGHFTYDEDDNGAAYWIFETSDLERVRLGELTPNQVLPSDNGWLDIPINATRVSGLSVRGGGYDDVNNILYLSINGAMPDGNPVICAFSLGGN